MDNITHTAIGGLFTEAVYQTIRKKSGDNPKLRRNLHILSAFSSNFPDFDLLLQLVDSSSLGYLINHRGYTHTVLGVLIEFLFIFLIFKFIFKKSFSLKTLPSITLVISFGLLSHIGLDFMNSYGVHPFWPINNEWFYGDALYIIEPLLWITVATSLFHIIKRGYFKYFFLGFSLFSPLIFSVIGFSSWINTFFVSLFSIFLFFYLKNKTLLRIAKEGLIFSLLIICIFALQSTHTKTNLKLSLSKLAKGYKLIDIKTSPLPSNFMCWRFLGTFINKSQYRVYSGVYSPLKFFLKSCPLLKSRDGVLPNLKLKNTDHIKYNGLYTQPIQTLKNAYSLNCKTAAWFTYARVPFFFKKTLHDLRYSIRSKKGFAHLNLSAKEDCPILSSPWTPPRKDVLFSN